MALLKFLQGPLQSLVRNTDSALELIKLGLLVFAVQVRPILRPKMVSCAVFTPGPAAGAAG